METHCAGNPNPASKSTDNKAAFSDNSGASYAHAVLNFKQNNNNSNKENIATVVVDTKPKLDTNSATPTTANKSEKPENSEPQDSKDDSDTFTPVPTHSRKDRKYEQLKKDKHKHLVNGTVDNKKDNHEKFNKKAPKHAKPKQPEALPKEIQNATQIKEENSETKKVFVAAPIPKVNAWQVKNAPPTTTNQPSNDKRVLQPQKQETVHKHQAAATVVKAPKDRRKFNKKVCNILHNDIYIFLCPNNT